MLLIRCDTNQLDDYYRVVQEEYGQNDTSNSSNFTLIQTKNVTENITKRTEKANQHLPDSEYSLLQTKDVSKNITKRIEKAIQQIIPIKPALTLENNISVELIDNGIDTLNRTMVSINIVISSTGRIIYKLTCGFGFKLLDQIFTNLWKILISVSTRILQENLNKDFLNKGHLGNISNTGIQIDSETLLVRGIL